MTRLKEEIDQLYISMTKGAFIRFRAKWLEEAEMNTSYYFALEKKRITLFNSILTYIVPTINMLA